MAQTETSNQTHPTRNPSTRPILPPTPNYPSTLRPSTFSNTRAHAQAARIAAAGQAFARRYLSAPGRHCYMLWLLQSYATALAYTPPAAAWAGQLVPLRDWVRSEILVAAAGLGGEQGEDVEEREGQGGEEEQAGDGGDQGRSGCDAGGRSRHRHGGLGGKVMDGILAAVRRAAQGKPEDSAQERRDRGILATAYLASDC